MPASAVQTKTWFRPKGWFTDREVAIVVNRVLRDDPSKGDMHNRQAITPSRLWESLKDYDLWPLYAIGLIGYIPQSPPEYYITLTLRSIGFDAFTTNLLTIPAVSHLSCFWGLQFTPFTSMSSRVGVLAATDYPLERRTHHQSNPPHEACGLA